MSRKVRRWPLALIAAPAAVAVWSGWVGLGELSGFGVVHPLPGIVNGFQLNTAITLPIGVEAYGAYAMGAWLTPGMSDKVKRFAKRSAIGSLALGMLGQMAYHLLTAWHQTRAPWPVVVLVSCLPVVTLGFGAALSHLLRDNAEQEQAVPEPVAEPVVKAAVEPVAEPAPALPQADPEPTLVRAPASVMASEDVLKAVEDAPGGIPVPAPVVPPRSEIPAWGPARSNGQARPVTVP